MEWSEFARDLGRELAGLERDTILIVREREESRHYVQAMREPDRLYAEAVSNNFLDGPLLLTLADEEVMSEAGWRPPAEPGPDGTMGTGPRNWWTELPAYATAGDHGRLADGMVTALRDVQGVRRPSDLVYESFHRHGTGLIELLDFGLEVADPGRVNTRRRTSAEAPAWDEAAASAAVLAAPVPGPEGTDELEPRLADAKQRGDHTTYFELLLSADLVLPATAPAVEDPEAADLPTTMIGNGTYIVVFTSPHALVRSGHRPDLYRRTSFSQLALGWPDPAWHLAINPGLPSEVHLDPAAVNRLDATQRALAQPAPQPPAMPPPPAEPPQSPPVPPVAEPPRPLPSGAPGTPVTPGPPETPGVPGTAGLPGIASGAPLRAPHGTRLWHWDGTGDEATSAVPAAVFDAVSGAWTQVRADTVPAPRRD